MKTLFIAHTYLGCNGGGIYASRTHINLFTEISESMTLIYPYKMGEEPKGLNESRIEMVPVGDGRSDARKFFDLIYEKGAERYANAASKGIDITVKFAKPRKKVVAFTETGYPGVPYDRWWTEALGKGIQGKQIAYVTVLRNGLSKSYYHGPCKKSTSTPDFLKFVKGHGIRLLKEK